MARRQMNPAPTHAIPGPLFSIHDAEYVPGVCNIGPAEIAHRRAFGHVGFAASVVLLGLLLAINAPAWARLLLFFTAAGSATGYLQAMFHFCAGFGSRGVYNFGAVGTEHAVAEAADRARDRRRSLQITAGSVAIGLAVAIAAFLLPL